MKTELLKIFRYYLPAVALVTVMPQGALCAVVALKVDTVKGSGPAVAVPVVAEKCEGLGALQFTLTYDPAIVEPESVEKGSGLASGLIEFKVNSPGVLGIAIVSGAQINKPGELLKVRFKTVASEGSTELAITNVQAWDYENNLDMLVTTEPGSLEVTPESPTGGLLDNLDNTTKLIIGGLIVLVLILLIALLLKGRKNVGSS